MPQGPIQRREVTAKIYGRIRFSLSYLLQEARWSARCSRGLPTPYECGENKKGWDDRFSDAFRQRRRPKDFEGSVLLEALQLGSSLFDVLRSSKRLR